MLEGTKQPSTINETSSFSKMHAYTNFPSFMLCYTIVINAHIIYAPCGSLIGELINL